MTGTFSTAIAQRNLLEALASARTSPDQGLYAFVAGAQVAARAWVAEGRPDIAAIWFALESLGLSVLEDAAVPDG